MTTCKRCGEAYDPESKSAWAAGLCQGVRQWQGIDRVRVPPPPGPDNLMRLLTSLERRLLDTECGYIELEQGLSVQEEETRKLREHANSQWVQIERLREQATAPALRPDTVSGDAYRLLAEDCRRLERELGKALGDLAQRNVREEAEDKAGCYCDDYEVMQSYWVEALDTAQEAAADYHAAWQDQQHRADHWQRWCMTGTR